MSSSWPRARRSGGIGVAADVAEAAVWLGEPAGGVRERGRAARRRRHACGDAHRHRPRRRAPVSDRAARRTLALVDGEHHPSVTRDAIAQARCARLRRGGRGAGRRDREARRGRAARPRRPGARPGRNAPRRRWPRRSTRGRGGGRPRPLRRADPRPRAPRRLRRRGARPRRGLRGAGRPLRAPATRGPARRARVPGRDRRRQTDREDRGRRPRLPGGPPRAACVPWSWRWGAAARRSPEVIDPVGSTSLRSRRPGRPAAATPRPTTSRSPTRRGSRRWARAAPAAGPRGSRSRPPSSRRSASPPRSTRAS